MDSNFDLSLVISLAALLFSFLSPVLSSLIGGLFRLREKKLDLKSELNKQSIVFFAQHQAEVIEAYIQAVGCVSHDPTRAALSRFGEASGEIYLYVTTDLWPTLDAISDCISNSKFKMASTYLTALCKELASRGLQPRTLQHE